jgi:hypothetical protein
MVLLRVRGVYFVELDAWASFTIIKKDKEKQTSGTLDAI